MKEKDFWVRRSRMLRSEGKAKHHSQKINVSFEKGNEHLKGNPAYLTLNCEVSEGLKPFSLRELRRLFSKRISIIPNDDPGSIFILYRGDVHELLSLQSVVAVYLVQYFPIPRPQALLGHQNYQLVLKQISTVLKLYSPNTFTGFRISAPGENSSLFSRIKSEIARDIHLPYDPKEGNLFLRIRPSSMNSNGWELLIRISPRPLSTRSWRIYNMEGALNATVAAAMIEMTHPSPHDRFLNIMCGSGTLLIERLKRDTAQIAIGCDINKMALAGAQDNVRAAGLTDAIQLLDLDATNLSFTDQSFDAICADLPWGQLVGSQKQNIDLYPKVLTEITRVAATNARLVLLTHDIKLFESILPNFTTFWALEEIIKVFQGGLHPRIYCFQRSRT